MESSPRKRTLFTEAVKQKFILMDSVRWSRDRQRSPSQKPSICSYINGFRIILIGVPCMKEGKKLDQFSPGLKPRVRLEILNSRPKNVDSAYQIVLNSDSALYGVKMFNSVHEALSQSGPEPMDLLNVETRPQCL